MAAIDYTPVGVAASEAAESYDEIVGSRTEDLEAITNYIERQREKVGQFPLLADEIVAYERWLSNLSWYEKVIDSQATLATAKWYRDRVNVILGESIPEKWVPADAVKAAESAPKAPSLLPTIPLKYKLGVGVAGVGLLALFIATRANPIRKYLP